MAKYKANLILKMTDEEITETQYIQELGTLLQQNKIGFVPSETVLKENYKYKEVQSYVEIAGRMCIAYMDTINNSVSLYGVSNNDLITSNPNIDFNDVYASALTKELIEKMNKKYDCTTCLEALQQYNQIMLTLNPKEKEIQK